MIRIILKSYAAKILLISLFGILATSGIVFGAIIYVDDDNISGPWDGTQAHPYQTIQFGISRVNHGDTVFVFNGIYYEKVQVNKSIFLKGEDRENTIIDATSLDYPIYISADSVQVSGFTARNYSYTHTGIYANLSDDVTITNNIVTANFRGVYVRYSNRVTVSENTIMANDECGLYLYRSPNCIITQNTVIENNAGIYLIESDSNDVLNNTIMDNTNYAIYILYSYQNMVSENNIVNNGSSIVLRSSSNNRITNCNIRDNRNYGVYITPDYYLANDNIIYHNIFINNTNHAYDEGNNIWDNDYYFGGNYWSDYTGIDEDADGFGDAPYDISGGDNQDRYPFMYPWGNVTIFVDDDADPSWYDSIHVSRIQEGIDSVREGGAVYVYNGTYYEHVTIGKKMTMLSQNKDSVIVDGSGSGDVFSITVDSVTIKGFTVQNAGSGSGITIQSDYTTVFHNCIKNNGYGIHLTYPSDYNIILDNYIHGNSHGMHLDSSSNNIVMQNELSNNSFGLHIQNSTENNIYHNNFTDSTQNAYDEGANIWDNGYPSGGNYWSDYTGSDNYLGPNQDAPFSDGMGDTPYNIPGGSNQDNYPLINPWDGTSPYQPPNCGDANNDGIVNIVDSVYLIYYLFKNGPQPVPVVCIADVNGSGNVTIVDVVYINGYVLKGATHPVDYCCW